MKRLGLRPRRRQRASVIAAAAIALTLPAAVPAADPFYENLLVRGQQARARADAADAVRLLRVASFGLLEEPTQLAVALTELALAQAELDDRQGFAATAGRLLEIEERFGAYRAAALSAAARHTFEQKLAEWTPYEVLDRLPAFRAAAEARLRADLLALEPAQRRARLIELIAAEPERHDWRLMLAELDLEEAQPAAVAATLEPVLAAQPGNAHARCLRGRAAAMQGSCEAAIADLASCPPPAQDAAIARQLIVCLIAGADFDSAEQTLAQIPAPLRQDKSFRRLEREIRRGRKAQRAKTPAPDAATMPAGDATATEVAATDATPAPAPSTAPTTGGPTETASPETTAADPAAGVPAVAAAPPVSTPPPPPADPEGARAALAEARASFAAAEDEPATLEVLRVAEEIATRHPELAEAQFFAAEVAYRLRRWDLVREYADRGGTIPADRPALLFYLAVAQFETGDAAAAADTLRRCLPNLQRTDFVTRYSAKILGEDPTG